jgi:hypothetical protein
MAEDVSDLAGRMRAFELLLRDLDPTRLTDEDKWALRGLYDVLLALSLRNGNTRD